MGLISQEKIIDQILEVLEELRPNFLMHGGNIEFVDFKEGKLYVRLIGACIGCPASSFTLKLLVEETLKSEVPQVEEVIEVEN